MSAYNDLIAPQTDTCPACGTTIHREIQFKYGDTWQHRYVVGDPIRWGGNDVGERGHAKVVVEGYAGPCPVCGDTPDVVYDVVIESDVIADVRPSDRRDQYVRERTNYFVIEK
jgi:RNA polymerase subunit RPABC4/transcription elongation factor Spt4